jgi:ABC-type lipoprotein export system ATPase subunit
LLLPYLTVSENVTLPLMASKSSLKDLSAKEQHLKLLMESTGIYSLRDKYPFTISGGEAQRVALVRALANNPSILLADEPTGSLDAKNAEKMGELLMEINKTSGIAIIMATHSVNLANKMSKILHLEEGKLII